MRKRFLPFSILVGCAFSSSRIFAQSPCNLVINGDFEVAKTSPLGGQIANIGPFPNINGTGRDELATWVSTNYGSPDYYNSTAPTGTDTNPASANVWGSFIPFNNASGAINGALGLLTRDNYVAANEFDAEYVTERLSAPLKTGRSYYASMQVYCASRVKGASRIGLDITVNDPRNYSLIPIPNSSAQRIPTYTYSGHGIQSAGVITAQSWTEITGVFPGIDGAQYLNVGNFDSSTYQSNANPAAPIEQSYVYVDAIKIYEIPDAGLTPPCSAGNITIGRGCDIPGATYAWTSFPASSSALPNTMQISVNPSLPTQYTLTVTLPDGKKSISSVNVDRAWAGPHQSICTGQSAIIGAGCDTPGATYTWTAPGVTGLPVNSSTVQTTVSPTVATAYTLTVTSPNGTTYTSSTSVTPGVGVGPNPGPIRGEYNTPPGRIRATVSAVQGATSYDWYVNGVLQSTHGVSILFPISGRGDCDTPEIVDMQAVFGSCGTSYMVQRYFYPICQAGRTSSASATDTGTTAYPNPANESIMLPAGAEGATLLNDKGKTLQKADASGKLDVQSLPDGLYNLRMMQNGKLINQRIQVKH